MEDRRSPLDGLVHPATLERLDQAHAGVLVENRLHLGALTPGAVGVVEAVVCSVAPLRSFDRNGRVGAIGRVSLADATGEAELVLWNDETNHVQDGTFGPRVAVRFPAIVKAGYRGGPPELGLAGRPVGLLAPEGNDTLHGSLRLGPTEAIVGDGSEPRFRNEATITGDGGIRHVVLWDGAVAAAQATDRALPVVLEGLTPHPVLDGWWISTAATRVRGASTPEP